MIVKESKATEIKDAVIITTQGVENVLTPTFGPCVIQPSMRTLLASVYSTGKVYRFRLTRSATVTTSGTGTMNLATPVHPAQFTQYSALSALFTESRLINTRISWAFQGTSVIVPFAFAFDQHYSSGSPTFGQILSIPGAVMTNNDRPFTEAARRGAFYKLKVPNPWAGIASSATTPVIGGNNGAWLYSVAGATDVTADIATYLIECEYEFRTLGGL